MKNTIYIVVMFLACFVMACSDDTTEDFNGPYSLIVTGPASANPGSTQTYRLAPYTNPESYTWTVDGPAQIIGATTGAVVKIQFTSVGSVKVMVSNPTGDKAMIPVTVNKVSPSAVTTKLDGTGKLKDGASAIVHFKFTAELQSTPVITMLAPPDTSHFAKKTKAFKSGTIGPLVKVDAKNYTALYTAGPGDGIPEALIKGSISTADYGAVKMDSIYVQLYEVDNTAPLADLTYSSTDVNDSTVVTITATFTEPITFKNSLDSAIRIRFSGAGVGDPTALDKLDTLELVSADDPLVYTYQYTVNGGGTGPIKVEILNAVDYAANDLTVITNSGGILTVDNDGPITTGTASDTDPVNSPSPASIKISSSEAGTGSFIILKSTTVGPTDASKFFSVSSPIASGSIKLSAGKEVEITKPVDAGTYTVYFISVDEAGNYGAISTFPLTMN